MLEQLSLSFRQLIRNLRVMSGELYPSLFTADGYYHRKVFKWSISSEISSSSVSIHISLPGLWHDPTYLTEVKVFFRKMEICLFRQIYKQTGMLCRLLTNVQQCKSISCWSHSEDGRWPWFELLWPLLSFSIISCVNWDSVLAVTAHCPKEQKRGKKRIRHTFNEIYVKENQTGDNFKHS